MSPRAAADGPTRQEANSQMAASELALHHNCFDVLRLALAALVLYSHAYLLGGFGPEPFRSFARGQTIAGSLAVLGFFGLSGFLITDSYFRTPHSVDFLRRRVARLLPGYWACLVVTAGVFAPALLWLRCGDLNGYPWIGSDSAIQYITRNAFLHIEQWSIGTVLRGAAESGSINGSLWTLWPEFCCYLVLLAVGKCGLLTRDRFSLVIFTSTVAAFHAGLNFASRPPDNFAPTILQLSGLSPYILAFFVGVCCRREYRAGLFSWGGAVFFGGLLLVLLRWGGFGLAGPVILTLFLLNLGYSFALRLRHDLSYGVYIYGAVSQQFLAAIPIFASSVALFLSVSAGLTVTLAALSWFCIERRFLQRRRPPQRETASV